MLSFITAHEDVLVIVEAMLLDVLNPTVMYSMIDVKGHGVDEEVAARVEKRFTLSLMFNRGVVLAIDVHDDAAVKDVVKSQQWGFDVADVEPNREADVVANEQDVFVTVDVNGLVGSCRKRKLSVVWLQRYVVCEVSRCNRRNSTGVTEDCPATK